MGPPLRGKVHTFIGRVFGTCDLTRSTCRAFMQRPQHDSTLAKVADGGHDLGGVAAQTDDPTTTIASPCRA
jgi:hypothetical protein